MLSEFFFCDTFCGGRCWPFFMTGVDLILLTLLGAYCIWLAVYLLKKHWQRESCCSECPYLKNCAGKNKKLK